MPESSPQTPSNENRPWRQEQARAMQERRAREHHYYPTLKRFDGLADAYIGAMGGAATYGAFIRRVNPNAPVFNPGADAPYEIVANCYDYGMNDLDRVGIASDPGGIKQHEDSPQGLARFVDAAIRGVQKDGAHYISPAELPHWAEQGLRQDHYLMAMYVRPQMMGKTAAAGAIYDYHFVRQAQQGAFAHKPGPMRPENTDYDQQLIVDPLAANMGNYVFVGFFAVPRNGLDVGEGPRHARPGGHSLAPAQRRALDAQLLSESSLKRLKPSVEAAMDVGRAREAIPPLLLAVDRGDRVAVEAFIAAGSDLNVQGSLVDESRSFFSDVSYRAEQVTPLIWAVQRQDRDMVAALLAAGADASLLDRSGWSALEYASGEALHKEPDTRNEIYQLLKAQPGRWGKRLEAVGDFFEHLLDSAEVNALKEQLRPMLPFLQGQRFWDKDDSGLVDADELAHVLVANGIDRIEDVSRDGAIRAHDLVQQWNARMHDREQGRH